MKTGSAATASDETTRKYAAKEKKREQLKTERDREREGGDDKAREKREKQGVGE